MAIRQSGTHWRDAKNMPVRSVTIESVDPLSSMPVIVQDWETGEKSGSLEDYYKKGDEEMPPKISITKEEFIKAVNSSKNNAEAARKLGMVTSTFYKYRKKWGLGGLGGVAVVNKDFENAVSERINEKKVEPGLVANKEISINEDFEKAVVEMDNMIADIKPEVELVDQEPWPEEECVEQNKPGQPMRVLDALDVLEDLKNEHYSVIEILDQVDQIHPRIRLILEKQQHETCSKIGRIEDKLRNITVEVEV